MIDILADRIETPLGLMLLLVRDGVLIGLEFDDQPQRVATYLRLRFGKTNLIPASNPRGFSARVQSYFAGDLTAIAGIPSDGGGTEFQHRVWAELKRIPCGATITYRELARRVGDPQATRAVGHANGRNPISVVVPCHRVVGSNGSLTGYGGGVARKKWLLAHEGAAIASMRSERFSSARAAS